MRCESRLDGNVRPPPNHDSGSGSQAIECAHALQLVAVEMLATDGLESSLAFARAQLGDVRTREQLIAFGLVDLEPLLPGFASGVETRESFCGFASESLFPQRKDFGIRPTRLAQGLRLTQDKL